jgi:hypothetical protein
VRFTELLLAKSPAVYGLGAGKSTMAMRNLYEFAQLFYKREIKTAPKTFAAFT